MGDYSNRALRRKRSFSQIKHLFFPKQMVYLTGTDGLFTPNKPCISPKHTIFSGKTNILFRDKATPYARKGVDILHKG